MYIYTKPIVRNNLFSPLEVPNKIREVYSAAGLDIDAPLSTYRVDSNLEAGATIYSGDLVDIVSKMNRQVLLEYPYQCDNLQLIPLDENRIIAAYNEDGEAYVQVLKITESGVLQGGAYRLGTATSLSVTRISSSCICAAFTLYSATQVLIVKLTIDDIQILFNASRVLANYKSRLVNIVTLNENYVLVSYTDDTSKYVYSKKLNISDSNLQATTSFLPVS